MDEPIVVGLRLIQYVGVALMLGVPALLAGAGSPSARWTRPLVAAAALTTALAAAAGLVAQSAVMAGSWSEALKPASLSMVAAHTSLGLSMGIRSAVALLALGLVLILPPGRAAWAALTAAGAVAAASFAWSGHAGSAEGPGATLHLGADVVHAVAAAFWLGALAALGLTCLRRDGAQDPAVHRTFRAFSGPGTIAVVTLTLTGLINAGFLVGPDRVGDLMTTGYGRLLVLKIALFAVMLALAASNRWRLTPALGAVQAAGGDAGPAFRRLRTSVAAEAAVGLALLAVVALLGVQPPPGRM
ncbi:MAG: copper homeostasis membrane protein CopD [Alphaproteobacteria bacterium]|nr:copper homeostasis membrane protein CopD [Alphaproteobacteria bacterium]MBU1526633.1 copper homeostasis membrane protein CopD [Alphaproteobacteria bacterium]MBU2118575.1 copper homeostasis membrane protein CopD [Alphaproteobacteria bacterium]MBU2351232.1 copper homeostasis membrane protein CopD [Alphaproteobacteria bacterium]MBU2381471.1 copper homeostasis membrane protein CopD [Alphaproteobacteria bacterium]